MKFFRKPKSLIFGAAKKSCYMATCHLVSYIGHSFYRCSLILRGVSHACVQYFQASRSYHIMYINTVLALPHTDSFTIKPCKTKYDIILHSFIEFEYSTAFDVLNILFFYNFIILFICSVGEFH